jgi:hypothetical protein
VAADERILGRRGFIERLRAEAAGREEETLRLTRQVVKLAPVGRKIMVGEGMENLRYDQGDGREAW